MSQAGVITIQNENYRLGRLISERVSQELDDRTEVYESLRQRDNRPVILKLRYQRPPHPRADPQDTAAVIRSATNDFQRECHALQACQMPQVPTYYAHEELVQGNHDPYAEGYLNALVMSKLTGLSIMEMTLSAVEVTLVEQQLAQIFEEIRRRGFEVGDTETEHVFLDRATNQTEI
ncbi:hypothetical protein VTN77DRAFT_945 [Rasamsonia byssochlamydoides]|uniref:uncharacterized protein n=1 Tax=Rasamsonia byssochlamydoides TaxID=89139 RepID=UPI003742ECCF